MHAWHEIRLLDFLGILLLLALYIYFHNLIFNSFLVSLSLLDKLYGLQYTITTLLTCPCTRSLSDFVLPILLP